MRNVRWFPMLVSAAAFGLGLLALLVALSELSSGTSSTERWISVVNLLTGLCGVAGAVGFAINQRWGAFIFTASALGHTAAHIGLASGLAGQGPPDHFWSGGSGGHPGGCMASSGGDVLGPRQSAG